MTIPLSPPYLCDGMGATWSSSTPCCSSLLQERKSTSGVAQALVKAQRCCLNDTSALTNCEAFPPSARAGADVLAEWAPGEDLQAQRGEERLGGVSKAIGGALFPGPLGGEFPSAAASRAPPLPSPPGLEFHFFLRSSWAEAGEREVEGGVNAKVAEEDEERGLTLELKNKGFRCLYDERVTNLTREGAEAPFPKRSAKFLFFLSPWLLRRPFVQLEVFLPNDYGGGE